MIIFHFVQTDRKKIIQMFNDGTSIVRHTVSTWQSYIIDIVSSFRGEPASLFLKYVSNTSRILSVIIALSMY
jgi:hypothetical protein